jgi:hypothetical protein
MSKREVVRMIMSEEIDDNPNKGNCLMSKSLENNERHNSPVVPIDVISVGWLWYEKTRDTPSAVP